MTLAQLYTLVFHDWAGHLGMPAPLLHVHAGLVILVGARLVFGLSFRSFWMIAIVLLAAFAKELADLAYHGVVKPDALSDVLHTTGWPIAIVMIARLRASTRPSP